jgi:hypothetical protein
LTAQKKDQILSSIDKAEQGRPDEFEGDDNDKIGQLERKLDLVLDRLGSITHNDTHKKRKPSYESDNSKINQDWLTLSKFGSVKNNYLDNSVRNSSTNVINSIDSRLFKRTDSYQNFEKLCRDEFLSKFYTSYTSLTLKLSSDFLKTAHFWIIPGGITNITDEYVQHHPFITAVFVLIAMSFDENYQYADEQQELHWIVKRLLGLAVVTTPLTDHDAEAVLYCCIYNISRKPLQPLLDTWSLSADGIKSLMLCVNFTDIKRRVVNEGEFDDVDLFHLRIWTSLSINHLASSIGYGRPHLIPPDYYDDDLAETVVQFPAMTLGDNINYAQLKLMKITYNMFHSKSLFERVIKFNEFETINVNEKSLTIFKFRDLDDWFHESKNLISLDTSGTLLFNLEFYYITLSKRFVSFYRKINQRNNPIVEKYLKIGLNTAVYYSIQILNRAVELPSSLIRGSPSSFWNQVVYSCLTLYEFNDKLPPEDFNIDSSLNLISQVYWRLNKIGEIKNDATDTVGQIIRSLVDVSHQNQSDQELRYDNDYDDVDGNYFIPLHDEISHEYSNDFNFIEKVSQFDRFEDFFNDLSKIV